MEIIANLVLVLAIYWVIIASSFAAYFIGWVIVNLAIWLYHRVLWVIWLSYQ